MAEHRGRAPALPFPGADQPLALGQPARYRQDQRHGHVGGVLGQHARRVGDADGALAGGGEVDVIDAGAERGDELQPRPGGGDPRGIDAVGDRRHQHVGLLHRRGELGLAQRRILEIEPHVEQLHHPRLDRVGQLAGDHDQDLLRHRALGLPSGLWHGDRGLP